MKEKIFNCVNFLNGIVFKHIQFSSKNLYISFSGKIYNKKNLTKQLKLTTSCEDTVLIEKLYQKYDTELFKQLDGVFTITIYDKSKEKLYLVRDRVGVQPLYFYDYQDTLIYGNHLKDFYHVPTFTKKIDKQALAVYLNYGYVLQPYTIFEHTHKVKAGHYVSYDLKTRDWQQKPYWSLESCYDEKKIYFDEKEIISTVEDILLKSIAKRIDEKETIATALSGGYDSSIVTAILQKKTPKNINTFTIGFHQASINEAPYAKEIAKHLGTTHHEHYFDENDALSIVPKLSEIYDEPFADYAATPTALMSKLIKEHGFDTMFVGDGGDEVFATADDVAQFDKLLSISPFIKNSLYHVLNLLNPLAIPKLKNYKNFPTKYYKTLELLKAKDISQMVKIKPILFFDKEIEQLLKGTKLHLKTTFDEIDFRENSESVDQVIGSYFKTSMIDAELVKSFQASRASSITIKEPLLDNELISYMAKVSGDLKIKDGEKKYILKQIAHNYIPKKLLDRPKSGFDIPFSLWLKGSLKELLFEHINKKTIEEDGLFDAESVLFIRDAFYDGNDSYKYKLWTLFLFQLWFHNLTKSSK